jgi:MFS family permease
MSSNALRRMPFHARVHRLDLIGAVLMMAAAIALLLALSWGGQVYVWTSPQIGALFALSSLLWALFAWRIARAAEPFLPLTVLANPVVRSAALAGACAMGTLVGMTIYVPLYFEAVLHLSAAQSGLALIPLMGATVLWSTITGRLMTHMTHYKRVPLAGLVVSLLALLVLASVIAPPIWIVLILLFFLGSGLGTVFPISTVCMQNAVVRHQMGIATGVSNFFRALFSSLVVAALGAIVLGSLGGSTGMAVEALARDVPTPEIAHAFGFVFLACALVVAFGIAFLIAMEQRPLKGPTLHAEGASAPPAPATPIPD